MVLSHPLDKFVFDALPPQPADLGAHGKRVPDLGDRIHGRAKRKRANHLVSDPLDARLERSHALGREERVERSPKRGVLRLVQGVGYHAMGGYSRGERGRVGRRRDHVGMSE